MKLMTGRMNDCMIANGNFEVETTCVNPRFRCFGAPEFRIEKKVTLLMLPQGDEEAEFIGNVWQYPSRYHSHPEADEKAHDISLNCEPGRDCGKVW
jgi:hypothetical protein